ncbi:hypothetical protein K0M31_004590 [Melipona bicolor]|uniref:Uncharacterized protein n=1 Tax=Melipona bicolor TaxID=60889 RepID=A0AA40FXV4_9HYME|nr:hypothetical protein K0M31_004590 [Melipona bicolor]
MNLGNFVEFHGNKGQSVKAIAREDDGGELVRPTEGPCSLPSGPAKSKGALSRASYLPPPVPVAP